MLGHGDDARGVGRREMGDPLGGCAGAGARGAHNQLVGVRICRIDFWRRTFICASATTDSRAGPVSDGDACGDAGDGGQSVGLGLGRGAEWRRGGRIMGRVCKSLERSQPW